jgi:hypothetical protein
MRAVARRRAAVPAGVYGGQRPGREPRLSRVSACSLDLDYIPGRLVAGVGLLADCDVISRSSVLFIIVRRLAGRKQVAKWKNW